MLCRDFMPRSHNAALEQREGRFPGVCMYVTMCVFPRVINRLVLALEHFIERIRIDGRLVSQNHFDPSADIRIDNLAHRLGLRILRPNQSEIAVALPDADYNRHVTLCAPTALLACN